MNLFSLLNSRSKPITIGIIGAGKFATMFFSQALKIPSIHIVGVVDIHPENAKSNMEMVGWDPSAFETSNLSDAFSCGKTFISDNWEELVYHESIEIIVECTGNPIAAVEHCLSAFKNKKNVINVTVEADAFCGFALSQKANDAGVLYSMAYGDQPALTCELVDWARTCGFNVVAAGRGHKWLKHYQKSTPDTVWDYWGLTKEQADRGRLNAKMFNAFLDGSKPSIESVAIANTANLSSPSNGLIFPSGGIDDIPTLMRPISEGGILEKKGMVDVVSCITPNGKQIPYDIRKGVWVVFEADTEYLKNCFEEYKVITDPSGKYMSLYKRWHLIGLELAISIASIGIRKETTGASTCFNADCVAIAKRNLKAGEILDGEGGYTVSGGIRPASTSIKNNYLPLGLAHNISLQKPISDGQVLTWDDVKVDSNLIAHKLRKEMESNFSE
jgi:predicted homoserine dehydrogenase-like protein